jgi:hypothetical protein
MPIPRLMLEADLSTGSPLDKALFRPARGSVNGPSFHFLNQQDLK